MPVANKGEEAIVRGIEDMLSDDRPVRIGLFDDVEEVTYRDTLTIFPRKWVFRYEGKLRLSKWQNHLFDALVCVQMRFGNYSKLQHLVSSSDQKYHLLQDFFNRADYVLVGHDSVFCAESCGVIHLAMKAGKCTGILGSSTGIGVKERVYKGWLYRRALQESRFCVFRERYTLRNIEQVCLTPAKLIAAPDPAFAMRPAEPLAVRKVLERYERYQRAKGLGKNVVGATVLEKGEVFAGFRPELIGTEKRKAHAKYLAVIFDSLIKERNAFVVFLPHSIEKGCSDITAAKHVAEEMTSEPGNYIVIDEDLPARLLKGIIRECDFLVGERTHSLIGSISVNTPFLALTNRRDLRTHGIIGDMCQLEDQIADIDVLDEQQIRQKALSIFDSRQSIERSLRHTNEKIAERLAEVSRIIKSSNTRIH